MREHSATFVEVESLILAFGNDSRTITLALLNLSKSLIVLCADVANLTPLALFNHLLLILD